METIIVTVYLHYKQLQLWCIWFERNRLRHNNGVFSPALFLNFFFNALRESANLAFKPASPVACNRPIFRFLGLSPLCASAPPFVPISWQPPPPLWVKANIDGSFMDHVQAGSGGVFRDSSVAFLGAFSKKVTANCVIITEILAFIEAVTIALNKGWNPLWIETDSSLVVHYFHNPQKVPWCMRVAWLNAMDIVNHMTVRVSHIYREGNKC